MVDVIVTAPLPPPAPGPSLLPLSPDTTVSITQNELPDVLAATAGNFGNDLNVKLRGGGGSNANEGRKLFRKMSAAMVNGLRNENCDAWELGIEAAKLWPSYRKMAEDGCGEIRDRPERGGGGAWTERHAGSYLFHLALLGRRKSVRCVLYPRCHLNSCPHSRIFSRIHPLMS